MSFWKLRVHQPKSAVPGGQWLHSLCNRHPNLSYFRSDINAVIRLQMYDVLVSLLVPLFESKEHLVGAVSSNRLSRWFQFFPETKEAHLLLCKLNWWWKKIIMRIEGRTPTEQKGRGRKTEWAKSLHLCVSVIGFFFVGWLQRKADRPLSQQERVGLAKAFSVILIKVLCHVGHKESWCCSRACWLTRKVLTH